MRKGSGLFKRPERRRVVNDRGEGASAPPPGTPAEDANAQCLRHLFADRRQAPGYARQIRQLDDRDRARMAADTVGFAVLPRRWVVERTLAWLNRNAASPR